MNQRKIDLILSKVRKEDFLEMLHLAKSYKDIDVDSLYKAYCEHNSNLPSLYERWEDSVKRGNPDFSVYGDDAYLNESFTCWKLYAREYIKSIKSYLTKSDCEIDVDEIHTIVDLGCGCGYSVVALKSVFPNARVIGTNLKGTLQFELDKRMCEDVEGCSIVDESETLGLGSVDFVFASEFFEHLDNPTSLLENLIKVYNPRYFVIANTFTKMSLGHFEKYHWDDSIFEGRVVTYLFNDYLRSKNYKSLNTGFFNNRPRVWKLMEKNDALF